MKHAEAVDAVMPPLSFTFFMLQGLREHPFFLASKTAIYALAARLGFSTIILVALALTEVACLLYIFRLYLLRHRAEHYRACAFLTQEILAAKRERLHFRSPFHRVGHEQSIQTTR